LEYVIFDFTTSLEIVQDFAKTELKNSLKNIITHSLNNQTIQASINLYNANNYLIKKVNNTTDNNTNDITKTIKK